MFQKHHTTIFNFLLIFGFGLYLFFVINKDLSIATIALIFFIYIWAIGHICLGTLNIDSLIHVSTFSGAIFALTYFSLFGIEEVPYPEGAIVFHSQEIALSLTIFFISSIIFLYYNRLRLQDDKNKKTIHNLNENHKPFLKTTCNQNWEEATLEDLESGKFEPI